MSYIYLYIVSLVSACKFIYKFMQTQVHLFQYLSVLPHFCSKLNMKQQLIWSTFNIAQLMICICLYNVQHCTAHVVFVSKRGNSFGVIFQSWNLISILKLDFVTCGYISPLLDVMSQCLQLTYNRKTQKPLSFTLTLNFKSNSNTSDQYDLQTE